MGQNDPDVAPLPPGAQEPQSTTTEKKNRLYDDYYAWHELCDFINQRFSLIDDDGNGGLTHDDIFYEWGHLTELRSFWRGRSREEKDNALMAHGINREKFRRDQDRAEPAIALERKDRLVQMGKDHQLPHLTDKQIDELQDLQQDFYQRQAQQAQQVQQGEQ
ncbi:MAG: hypothetical protein Q9195_006844 [Heterodermia aff. obscurata]